MAAASALALAARQASLAFGSALAPAAVGAARVLGNRGMALWSVEKEKDQVYKDPDEIIDHQLIERELESTKKAAQNPARIREILDLARERSFLTNYNPGWAFLVLPQRNIMCRCFQPWLVEMLAVSASCTYLCVVLLSAGLSRWRLRIRAGPDNGGVRNPP